jgi:hypothetical protein
VLRSHPPRVQIALQFRLAVSHEPWRRPPHSGRRFRRSPKKPTAKRATLTLVSLCASTTAGAQFDSQILFGGDVFLSVVTIQIPTSLILFFSFIKALCFPFSFELL